VIGDSGGGVVFEPHHRVVGLLQGLFSGLLYSDINNNRNALRISAGPWLHVSSPSSSLSRGLHSFYL